MSKELEALRNFISECENDWKTQPKRWVNGAINSNVSKYMDSLKSILTPPTAEEVCMALSDYFGFSFYYQDNFFYRSDGIKHIYPLKVSGFTEIQLYDGHLPPHLIRLIGRFYEGSEKADNEDV